MAAVIGALRVTLGADTASFEDGLKGASKSLSGFAKSAGAIAGGIQLSKLFDKAVESLGNLAMATFDAIDAMDRMGKEAQKLGLTTEELSKLTVAAKLSDVEVTELAKSMVRLSSRMVEGTDQATEPAARALKSLGISAKDASGAFKSGDVILGDIADKFSKLRDGVEKTTLATMLGGRGFANMIPLLNQGREGLRTAGEQAEKLNLVVGTETAKAAERFNDNMKLIGLGMTQGIVNVIATAVLPALDKLSERLLRSMLEPGFFQDMMTNFKRLLGLTDEFGKKIVTMDDVIAAYLRKQKEAQDRGAIITAEQVKITEDYTKKIEGLRIQTLEASGAFSHALAPGLMQTAVQMKLVNAEFFLNAETMAGLQGRVATLNMEMLKLKGTQVVFENTDPLTKYNLEMGALNLQLQAVGASSDVVARAQEKLAEKFGLTWSAMGKNVADFMGSMQTLTGVFGKQNKTMFIASQAFGIAQAVINTQIAITKALATLPPPASFIAAAAAAAAGAAAVATIVAQKFATGGSFMVPGAGGIDSTFVPIMATPGERVTVETPEQQRRGSGEGQTIVLQGSSFHFNEVRDLFETINAGLRDGHRFKVIGAPA